MSTELNFLSDDTLKRIRDEKIKGLMGDLTEKLSDLNIEVKTEQKQVVAPAATPRYEKLELADVARDIYKTNIKEEDAVKEKSEEEVAVVTPAIRYNARALARSLVGLRNGGDAGHASLPAGPNGGNTGATAAPVTIATMSTEEYENYIDNLFMPEEDQQQETEVEQEFLTEDGHIEELEDKLLEMTDHSWTSIDKVMRVIAKEHAMTPKQLHKDFKAKHGMIPDDWAKMNEEVEQVGWYPLDEMVRINTIGQVFEVSFMFRGGRQRLKFFWPEVGYPSHNEMQEACRKFWPGAILLAYYPSHDNDNVAHNTMVVLPAMKENYEIIDSDIWEFMSEEDTEIYDEIAAEEGEPITPVFLSEDGEGYFMVISDHDTGEHREVMFGEGKRGLWDNIHAKRKRGEKPAKKGDKDYPKTLDIDEDLEQAKKNVGADSCWDGYKAKGTKKKGGKEVPNCVKEGDEMKGMSQKSGDKRSTESGAGMTAKGVAKYNRRTGGNLKTAVTTPPSKLKPGSKAAGRRKSFCARSRGWTGERGKAARRRWNC